MLTLVIAAAFAFDLDRRPTHGREHVTAKVVITVGYNRPSPMPTLVPSQRHLFDLPADVAYLNCAYISPLLRRAAEVGAEAIRLKCQPWRISAQEFFAASERARALFVSCSARVRTTSRWCLQ